MDHNQLGHSEPIPRVLDRTYDFVVHTFGCKVNTYDTGLIQKNLVASGYKVHKPRTKANAVHVLNTCAVTAEATQQAVRLIRKIKSQEPLATIVVTGCAAQVDTGVFENLAGVDLVVANSHKGLLPQILDQYYKNEINSKVFRSNIFRKEDLESGGGEELSHTRSFLKIQDGCNSFCTYCIIPYARGKSRSIPIQQLVNKINELEHQGVQEVVLTGVHIGDYEDIIGQKTKKLEDLIETLLLKTKMKRFRLSSLEPVELSSRLLEFYKDSRMCPHFHMSIQSVDTDVLKHMKRQYTEDDVKQSLNSIAENIHGAFVGMDVITGFPTETDEQFENTYKVLSELPWTKIHVFPYSERQGTRAATLPQLPMSKRKERAQRLRELSLHRQQMEALKHVGTFKKVLVLNKWNVNNQGLSRDYWNVNIQLSETDHLIYKNTEVLVQIESVDIMDSDLILKGKLIDEKKLS